jgi:branched-chain amino acid transport system substrate-binding protein
MSEEERNDGGKPAMVHGARFRASASGRGRRAFVAVIVAVVFGAGALAATGGAATAADTTTTTKPAGGWPAVDQPGVTDSTIRVSGVAATTNPVGGQYGTSFDGVQAYFNMINKQGGIYGRKLVIVKRHDDQLSQNAREVSAILNEDNVFAVLPVATAAAFSGAKQLVDANVPTFGWGINDEWGGPPNLFGSFGNLCNGSDCPSVWVPWTARKLGKHKLGLLAYTVAPSKACLDGLEASFKKYGKSAKAQIVYTDSALSYGVTDFSADVSKMLENKVDLVATCMDTNGVLSLAKEMRQQGLTAPQYLANANDAAFMKKNGGFFQGSVVITELAPVGTKPQFPALKQYVAQMKKLGKPMTENAEIGWANADNFVTGLKMAGPAFTRQKVVDELNTLTDYDAGGMLAPIDWTKQHTDKHYPRSCVAFMQVKSSKLVPVWAKPGKPFLCWTGADETTSVTKVTPVVRQ